MQQSPTNLPPVLLRTIYRFGSFQSTLYGYMTLREDGAIMCYSHPNENRFTFEGDHILLQTVDGRVTSRLEYQANINAFFSADERDLYMFPLVTLASSVDQQVDGLPVVVNSIPKAGTYLLELVFTKLNYKALGLHMSGACFDDNRYTPASEIHRAPQHRRRPCPSSAVTSIMRPGEIAVGHIDNAEQLALIAAQGKLLINLIRDLRSVLFSLYRFKIDAVDPVDAADALWRKLDEPGRFLAFLNHYAATDVLYIRTVAASMLQNVGAVFIRYEDLTKPEVPSTVLAALAGRVGLDLAEAIVREVPKALGASTSTLSKSWGVKSAGYTSLWNDDAERFFEASGLRHMNNRLGYP